MIKNILISGCSLSAGYGFPLGKQNSNLYPNLLSTALNAHLTNVSEDGKDNPGIFLNLLDEIFLDKYDLILIQFSHLSRINLSPSVHDINFIPVSSDRNPNHQKILNLLNYKEFIKVFVLLNKDFGHLIKLFKMIISLQNLSKKCGYNIKFINGLLHWDEEFFNNYQSKFVNNIIDFHSLPDNEIIQCLDIINYYKNLIDKSLWINLTTSLKDLAVDTVSETNGHPGPISHKLYADIILNNIN